MTRACRWWPTTGRCESSSRHGAARRRRALWTTTVRNGPARTARRPAPRVRLVPTGAPHAHALHSTHVRLDQGAPLRRAHAEKRDMVLYVTCHLAGSRLSCPTCVAAYSALACSVAVLGAFYVVMPARPRKRMLRRGAVAGVSNFYMPARPKLSASPELCASLIGLDLCCSTI